MRRADPKPAALRAERLNVVGDYPRQAYFAVAKASGVPALNRIPVVRHLELTLGYNARGFDDPRVKSGGRSVGLRPGEHEVKA